MSMVLVVCVYYASVTGIRATCRSAPAGISLKLTILATVHRHGDGYPSTVNTVRYLSRMRGQVALNRCAYLHRSSMVAIISDLWSWSSWSRWDKVPHSRPSPSQPFTDAAAVSTHRGVLQGYFYDFGQRVLLLSCRVHGWSSRRGLMDREKRWSGIGGGDRVSHSLRARSLFPRRSSTMRIARARASLPQHNFTAQLVTDAVIPFSASCFTACPRAGFAQRVLLHFRLREAAAPCPHSLVLPLGCTLHFGAGRVRGGGDRRWRWKASKPGEGACSGAALNERNNTVIFDGLEDVFVAVRLSQTVQVSSQVTPSVHTDISGRGRSTSSTGTRTCIRRHTMKKPKHTRNSAGTNKGTTRDIDGQGRATQLVEARGWGCPQVFHTIDEIWTLIASHMELTLPLIPDHVDEMYTAATGIEFDDIEDIKMNVVLRVAIDNGRRKEGFRRVGWSGCSQALGVEGRHVGLEEDPGIRRRMKLRLHKDVVGSIVTVFRCARSHNTQHLRGRGPPAAARARTHPRMLSYNSSDSPLPPPRPRFELCSPRSRLATRPRTSAFPDLDLDLTAYLEGLGFATRTQAGLTCVEFEFLVEPHLSPPRRPTLDLDLFGLAAMQLRDSPSALLATSPVLVVASVARCSHSTDCPYTYSFIRARPLAYPMRQRDTPFSHHCTSESWLARRAFLIERGFSAPISCLDPFLSATVGARRPAASV
ncbi:hypothetical protein C8R45DRAFT_936089 [Mycena sanguinolenta]|nr:hypothetical protein C8R45DRAFT_936089 [Mycena sanguinolenta]